MLKPNNILIILMGSVGDVARGLTLVPSIKTTYPEAKLSWLVEPRCEDLVRTCSLIDSVIVFQRGNGFKALLDLRKELKSQKFDLVLDLQRHFKSGFFSFLTGAPTRIGFHPKNAKEWNWIFNSEYISFKTDELPKIDHYKLFLEKIGINNFIDEAPIKVPKPDSVPGEYVVFVLGSKIPSKDWPTEHYKKLVEELSNKAKIKIVLVGIKSQNDVAEKIANEATINLVGKTSLKELIPVIAHAKLLVGPDSGPGHIAGLFGVKQITLFGPTPSKRNVPRGSEGLEIVSETGKMIDILPDAVLAKILNCI